MSELRREVKKAAMQLDQSYRDLVQKIVRSHNVESSSQGGAAMSHSGRVRVTLVVVIVAVLALSAAMAYTQGNVQPVNDRPNPYRTVENWAKMSEGRTWGATSAVDIDPDGKSIWVAERCGANTCAGSTLPVVLKFDSSGKLVKSFGAGMFIFPHGIHVDRQGNVWVTDGIPPGATPDAIAGKGHIVVKFSPDGKVLLTLGKTGVAGDGPDTFNQPSDVITAPNGDIFVADGHGGNSNARIVKFSKDGKFIKTWGKKGSAPGEFDTPHGLAMDSRGRLFVADRNNNRLQLFDQDGKFLEEWKQFSRLSGIYIDKNDVLYGTDSESNARRNPGWKRGIRVGSAKDGTVTAFIPDPELNPDTSGTSGAEGVAADARGNIYGAEVGPRALKRYVKP
jgi:sugar lactone lactonase YvrE